MSLRMEQLAGRARWTWSVGEFSGIETRVHWTVAVFALYLALSAAWSGGGAVGAGLAVCALGLVLGFVWLHELGHAMMARHYGIGTRSITLSPLGGLASLSSLPRTPKQELHVALAGPLVNVVLFVVAWGMGQLMSRELGVVGVLLDVALWSNAMLAIFNLLPVFPMDGGRVMRAWLEQSRGRLQATEITAKVGGYLAIVLGVWAFATGQFMTAMIAVFVWRLGRMELAQVRARAGSPAGRSFGSGVGAWSNQRAQPRRTAGPVLDIPHIERPSPRS